MFLPTRLPEHGSVIYKPDWHVFMNGEPQKRLHCPINGVIIHSTHLPKGSLFGVILNYQFGKENILKKKRMGVWRDHSAIESLLFCQRIGVLFPESTSGDSDLSLALGTLTPSSGLRGTHMHMHIHTGKHTHRYKNESLRKRKKITVWWNLHLSQCMNQIVYLLYTIHLCIISVISPCSIREEINDPVLQSFPWFVVVIFYVFCFIVHLPG